MELAVSTYHSRDIHTNGILSVTERRGFFSGMKATEPGDVAMIKKFIIKYFRTPENFDRIVRSAVSSFGDSAQAACLAGRKYELGIGVERDLVKARKLYQEAAEAGVPRAQANLGVFYQQGIGGLRPNPVEAVRLYGLAARKRDPQGLYNLGLSYERGTGKLQKDEYAMTQCYLAAAQQRNISAMVRVAEMYERGVGIFPRDQHRAAVLYAYAADQGSKEAQDKLSQLLGGGRAARR